MALGMVGLPLGPEKAPPGCTLHPCWREKGTRGGSSLNLWEKLTDYELRQKSIFYLNFSPFEEVEDS